MSFSGFFTYCFFLFLVSPSFSQINYQILDSGVLITEAEESILFYRTTSKLEQAEYGRAHYVHPLYTLDGEVLTEDFPDDHPHHHGVFWAWHQLYIGEKRIGDGWVQKDLEWKVVALENIHHIDGRMTISSDVEWLSPLWLDETGMKKSVVDEKTTITVYPKDLDFRRIDFTIALLANQPHTTIGGSEDRKGYGGFSLRIKLPSDISFEAEGGPIEAETTPVVANGWISISGAMAKNGSQAGMAILSHPSNPGYPNPWILRKQRSMQNAVYPHPGTNPVPLSDSEPTVLQYQLIIFGKDRPNLENLHLSYSQQ